MLMRETCDTSWSECYVLSTCRTTLFTTLIRIQLPPVCIFTRAADNFLNKICVGFSCGSVPPSSIYHLAPLSRRWLAGKWTTVGCWFVKSWHGKPSEVCPTRKTLMVHPGEPAGSCLQHYPPVYENALRDTGLYRVSLLGVSQNFLSYGRRKKTFTSNQSTTHTAGTVFS